MACASVDEERMKAVPVEQFEEHCNNYHRERDAAFEIEYEVTPLSHSLSLSL